MVREPNKVKRLNFCQSLPTPLNFDDVIFTDESTVSLNKFSRLSFYKVVRDGRGKLVTEVEKLQVGVPKHPLKLHVWAGISSKGATDLIMFSGIMDKVFFRDILEEGLLPYLSLHFPEPNSYRFQMDNDPKHKSNLVKQYIQDNNINYWPTPAESPDLNAIENVWAGM